MMGIALLRRLKDLRWREAWSVRALAALTGLMGVVNVLSAVTPAMGRRLALMEDISPLEVRQGGRLTAALAGFALLLLANSLRRRKRVAWLLTLVVLGLSAVSHMIKGLDIEEALLAVALGTWLFTLRPLFHARSDTPSVRQGLQVLAAAFGFTLAYGVAGFYLLDRHFSLRFGFGAAVRQTVVMFTQFYDPGLQPLTRFGRFFADSIYVVGAATFAYALFMLVRPVLVRQPASPAERDRARPIVEAHGRNALARFALFDDKSYYFSPGGSLVAYVAKGGAAVALGDPIGPSGDVAAAIAGYKAHCARNDWLPAFYQASPDYLNHYRAAGLETLCIGQEAVVDLATFDLSGKAGKPLRTMVNRLERLGHRAEMHSPPLSNSLLGELRSISDEWLTALQASEKRFSVGWFDDDYLRACPVMAVHLPSGEISAFANVVLSGENRFIAVDLMRHRGEVENGTMDFLFVELLQWARSQGFPAFDLGLSALSGIGESSGDPTTERFLRSLAGRLNSFYNFAGLHAYKAKFHPAWSPRYLAYPGPASLAAVTVALVRADSGDDFLAQYLARG
jgi:phosphatidylglycerol lysyltransferase